MTLRDPEIATVRLSLALLNNRRQQLEELLADGSLQADSEVILQAQSNVARASTSHATRLVAASMFLPAWVQYFGQRAILCMPRTARKLLYLTGIHNEAF